METTLPIPLIPYVSLSEGPEASEGLSRTQLALLGCVHFVAKNDDVDRLLQFLQRHVSIETHVDITSITSSEDIVSILDAGARKVFVSCAQRSELEKYGDRIVLALEASAVKAKTSAGLLIYAGKDASVCKSAIQEAQEAKCSPVFLYIDSDISTFVDIARETSAIPIVPSTSLSVEKASTDGKISVPEFIGGSWTSDRQDQLIPTVVTDERGIALGLVYSSQESLSESLRTGTGVYQSRKRGLWYKGATSGDVQELVKIALDCDQDCMKFVVRQKGRGKFENLFELDRNLLKFYRFLPPSPIIMLW